MGKAVATPESAAELVNMTARARRLLHAVRDRRLVLSNDDESNLHMLRLLLRDIAEHGRGPFFPVDDRAPS